MEILQEAVNKPVEKEDVSACLMRADDGAWIGNYRGFVLKTAFQPIFRFIGGKLRPIAFEGLLRPQKDDTLMLPGAFFNQLDADEISLVEAISRTLHVRNAASLPVQARQLFLNFDPAALASKSTFEKMVDDLGTELRASDIMPNACVCEIIESAARNKDDLRYFVYTLRARGYHIAVDDFGAQSSNMERIKDLTPDIVKLDGPMVKTLMDSPDGYRQLKELIAHFKELRIQVVAEGLEASWQIEMAESAGAHMVQGFAAAIPRIAPADFSEWFQGTKGFPMPSFGRPAAR
jgi:EAL domain-containing protein (putative c-di-GMP-specific phosphodiesterase class I)